MAAGKDIAVAFSSITSSTVLTAELGLYTFKNNQRREEVEMPI